ncbi:3-deoxy-manno-octulosonate cytidylyltransferase [Marinagarivorans algicola]|uniref:3-deoxy-manno-octulosonate cytidylyltransferase n=1 Tax=Marinagarivorans algicola TaxID=1513270 RepID=UPI0006B52CED|nr:3-deoxy-manno-octulosonate cytidylyltransferase [Marinagarivorans algicola]
MSFIVVIPARYASTRLEGKPLMTFAGLPMIEHVYRAACQSEASQVLVATDDQRIEAAVKAFGGNVCMTRNDHDSGTDRLQEVAAIHQWSSDQIIVNVQGDEPLIPPAVINQVANNLAANKSASASTLSWPIHDTQQLFDPNAVKVVVDNNGLALYFSRAPMPWVRDSYSLLGEVKPPSAIVSGAMRHIGIYGYRVGLLHQFIEWPMAQLEVMEKLEQLRILANGQRIHVAKACREVPAGVDTQEDVERVKALLGA